MPKSAAPTPAGLDSATRKPAAHTSTPAEPPAFTGFGPRALDFFKALAFHQDKAWFAENRALYDDEVRAPLVRLLADLTGAFAEQGLPLKAEPKLSIFRLHRDTRFAKDKRPYKTNGGAVLSRDGSKKSQGFLYVHLDPQGCFMAAGFWQPEPDETIALRQAMAARPAAFRNVLSRLEDGKLALGDGDSLSRAPKGFESVDDPVLAPLLRMRNLIVREPIADDMIRRADLRDRLVDFATRAEPLLRFGWTALDSREPSDKSAHAGRR